MTDFFTTISSLVDEAADKADLRPCLGGFEGDAWVWYWRVEPSKERTSEARLRIRPDSLAEGAQVEVSAAAWIEKRRDIATSRVVWSQFFDASQLQEHSRIVPALYEHLREGRSAAIKLGQSLDKLAQRRDDTLADLKRRGLFQG